MTAENIQKSREMYNNFPDELKQVPNWCNFKFEPRGKDGKISKVPYSCITGRMAKANDPNTWGTFDQAVQGLKNTDGIGFFFSPPYFGVDIDHMNDMGDGDEIQKEFMNTLQSYTELSPSGNGIHVICRGHLPKGGNRKGCFEMYDNGRYFTMTGNMIGNYGINECTESIKSLHEKYIGNKNPPKKPTGGQPQEEGDSTPLQKIPCGGDSQPFHNGLTYEFCLSKALNDPKLSNLYHSTPQDSTDKSKVDMKLANKLAFYLQKDKEWIRQAMFGSGLVRDKWTAHKDYLDRTIEKAIVRTEKTYDPDYGKKSHKGNPSIVVPSGEGHPQGGGGAVVASSPADGTQEEKKRYINEGEILTPSMIRDILKQQYDIEIAFNVISHDVDILTSNKNSTLKEFDFLQNELFRFFKICKVKECNFETLGRFTEEVAFENRYNPFLEMLKNKKWDGKKRLPELFDIMHLNEEDTLSRVLIHKWLLQAVAMQYNSKESPFSAEGCLVLVGGQRFGKSSFFRELMTGEYIPANLFAGEQYLNFKDKDTLIRNTSFFITELSEIESTMKGDKELLKGFITTATDMIRVPYGKKDRKFSRHSTFGGSCNSIHFLRDIENRRFWTILLEQKMDVKKLAQFDSFQLWLEIQEEVEEKGFHCFRLSDEEADHLQKRNRSHSVNLKGEEEVMAILKNKETCSMKTIDEFKHDHNLEFSSIQIGKILNKHGVTQVRNKTGRLYDLP